MNTYFQFKKFTIHQNQCAMKVTEIACIQGAWTQIPPGAKTVLDIGCGTGLLSLMLAQKYQNIQIDAIEIDELCVAQAKENVANSIYRNSIKCIHSDIKKFTSPHQYDFIITNPPFFERHLKSPDQKKNTAWHSDDLTLNQLFECIDKLLKPKGCFSILLPVQREDDAIITGRNYGLYPTKLLQIRHSAAHRVSYLVFLFTRNNVTCAQEIITMKEMDMPSEQFVILLKQFYLKL